MSADSTDLAIASSPSVAERMLEWLELGGPVVFLLLAMSVVALTIVLVKLWQFRALRLSDLRPAQEAMRLHDVGRPAEALAMVERSRNPIAETLARALRGKLQHLPETKVREEVFRHAGVALESLRSGFRPLEVIASLAPLLGLFGTVLGMIEAFQRLEAAGNRVDPSILSGGIWEALLTTAVGLAVAIPAIVVLNWLERRVDRVAHAMDGTVARVFTVDLSGDVDKAEGDAPGPSHDIGAADRK